MDQVLNKAAEFIRREPLVSAVGILGGLFVITQYIMPKIKPSSPASIANPGNMSLSFLGQSDLPRGIRNNNPGNLTKTLIPWKGKLLMGSDSRFEQFESFVWGTRAMMKDLKNDIVKDGQNTPAKLISEYAPENENNTAGYIQSLANKLNIGVNDVMVWNATSARALVQAISRIENGNPASYGFVEWISDEMAALAYSLI